MRSVRAIVNLFGGEFSHDALENKAGITFFNLPQDIPDLFNRLQLHKLVAKLLDMGKTFQVVRVVTPHFEDADDRALPFDRAGQVIADRVAALFDRRWRKVYAGVEIMFDLPEDPGIADGGAADHDPVHAITVTILAGFFRRFNIAIAEDGDADAGIFLYPGDQGPVGVAFVKLGPGASMDG